MNDVTIGLDSGVMILTLNRPEKKNALSQAMYGVLADALAEAEADPDIRVVLLTGAGGAFTSGNDLADFAAANAGGGRGEPESRSVYRFLMALANATVPIVAAVPGLAVGVGTTMLLHCDLVYIAEDARLTTPFVNLALVPEAASSWLLPARVGHARAYAMFALGEAIRGDEAARIGLANAAYPKDEVFPAALAAAKVLAAKPAGALKITKSLMRDADKIAALMKLEMGHFDARLQTAEAAEAFAAFAQRRAPDFSRVG